MMKMPRPMPRRCCAFCSGAASSAANRGRCRSCAATDSAERGGCADRARRWRGGLPQAVGRGGGCWRGGRGTGGPARRTVGHGPDADSQQDDGLLFARMSKRLVQPGKSSARSRAAWTITSGPVAGRLIGGATGLLPSPPDIHDDLIKGINPDQANARVFKVEDDIDRKRHDERESARDPVARLAASHAITGQQ